MQLLVIAGFLGSGKTTLLIHIARELTGRGRRVAIVENEIGKVGIDDAIVADEGLDVREIFSGCICCTLRLDLVTTLLELEREHKPDVLILEPSGVAGPRQVVDALKGYGGEIERRSMVVLLDARRFGKIQDLALPIIADGVAMADLVVMNKADLVTGEMLQEVRHRVAELRDDVPCLAVSSVDGRGLEEMKAKVVGLLDRPGGEAGEGETGEVAAPRSASPPPMAGATAVSEDLDLRFDPAGDGAKLAASLGRALESVAADLRDGPTVTIGHIKAVLRGKEAGFITASVTDFDEPARFRGRLAGSVATARLTLNAIVLGAPKERVRQAVTKAIGTMGDDVPERRSE